MRIGFNMRVASRAREWISPISDMLGKMRQGSAYAQGDVLLVRSETEHTPQHSAAWFFDQTVILLEGEHTGHRHAFYDGAVMFRDDALAREIPRDLYVGHVHIARSGAVLEHGPGPGRRGDHDSIKIPRGTYIVLRQREYTGSAADTQGNAFPVSD